VQWRDPPGIGHRRVAAVAQEVPQDGQVSLGGGEEHGRIACSKKRVSINQTQLIGS
jgi:hypothetical protein